MTTRKRFITRKEPELIVPAKPKLLLPLLSALWLATTLAFFYYQNQYWYYAQLVCNGFVAWLIGAWLKRKIPINWPQR